MVLHFFCLIKLFRMMRRYLCAALLWVICRKNIFICMYVYVRLSVNVYHVHLSKDVGQNNMSDHLKLKLNAVVNCLM